MQQGFNSAVTLYNTILYNNVSFLMMKMNQKAEV